MVDFNLPPKNVVQVGDVSLYSFVDDAETNVDLTTVNSFGEEWEKFNSISEYDIAKIGHDYFDLVDLSRLSNAVVLDVGCGGGRWARFLSPHVRFIEAIDPGTAAVVAAGALNACPNVRVTRASVNHMPFPNQAFDLVFSLGVLHHVPNTQDAIACCYEKIKVGGLFLLYLYYNPSHRGLLFSTLFKISDYLRRIISRFPSRVKRFVCDLLALLVYWPLANASRLVSFFSENLASKIPLSYYRKTSFYVMRNDALDRFGTPLEKRFSKEEITLMLTACGFRNIRFSEKEPFWHVLSEK